MPFVVLASINTPTSQVTTPILVPAATIDAAGSFHIQARIRGFNSTSIHTFGVGGYGLDAGTGAFAFDVADTVTPTVGNCTPLMGTATDVLVDITRDLTVSTLYPLGFVRGMVFDTLKGTIIGQCTYTITAQAAGSTIVANQIYVGNTGATGNVDFIRWSPGTSSPTTIPHPFTSSTASWADYEFATSPTVNTDTSGFDQNFSGLSFAAIPVITTPVCQPGPVQYVTGAPPQTVAAGQTMSLDGTNSYSLNGNSTLTYLWSNAGAGSDGVSQTATYATPTAATTTVTGMVNFGSFNSTLAVTDSGSHTTSCTLHGGIVVASTTSWSVDLSAEGLSSVQQFIVGPQIAFGHNQWPYADQAVINELNLNLAALQSGGIYSPYWKTLQSGTITITGGSPQIVGSGTAFKSTYCGGGTGWDGITILIWRYTGTDGFTHYNQFIPTSTNGCPDDTHMNIADPFGNGSTSFTYPSSPTAPWPDCTTPCSGLGYGAIANNSQVFTNWTYFQSPAMYYDVPEFFLVNYWRSGSDLFYSGAKIAAPYWLENPINDYYTNCETTNNFSPGNTRCLPNRSISLTGIILWQQMHGGANSDLLASAINHATNYYQNYIGTLIPAAVAKNGGIAERENAYAMSGASLPVLIQTDPTIKATWQSTIKNNLLPAVTAGKRTGTLNGWNILNYSNTSTPGCSVECWVEVTNGSTTIHGVNTIFDGSEKTYSAWTYPGPGKSEPVYCGTCPTTGNVVGGDGISYVITAVDVAGQNITIYPAYQGSTCTGTCHRGFLWGGSSGLVGYGFQPYMAGLTSQSFYHLAQSMSGYDAPSQALFLSYGDLAAAEFIATITPDQGGVYNGAYYPGCIPPMLKTATLTQSYCYGAGNEYQGGAWNSATTYAAAAYVIGPDGLQYQSKANANTNNVVTDTTWWNFIPLIVDPGQQRQLANEGMRALVYTAAVGGTNAAAAKAAASTLMSQLYAPPSDSRNTLGAYLNGYDLTIQPAGGYVCALSVGCTAFFEPNTAKYAGQLSGFTEGAITWPGYLAIQSVVSTFISGKTSTTGKVSH